MKTIEATNFIEQIINGDIESGKIEAVQTRFPPEPNGYLHIGHIKSMLVNFGTAKKYEGKCNLFFDDTNPSKEKTEFVDAIRKDIEWVGYNWAKEVYASDFFPIIYEYAEKLIMDGKAFVCDLSPEEISATRGTLTEAGKESPYRNRSVVCATQNTIDNGVAHVHIRRRHIDFRAQTLTAVGVFPRFHFTEKL